MCNKWQVKLKIEVPVPYKVFLRLVEYELLSTWLFHCVFYPQNTLWPLHLQREEASSSSKPLNDHHSSAVQYHKQQRGVLRIQLWILVDIPLFFFSKWHFIAGRKKQMTIVIFVIVTINMIVLTKGSSDCQRWRFLGFLTETQLIDSLDTEHIRFSCGQATNHKSEEK